LLTEAAIGVTPNLAVFRAAAALIPRSNACLRLRREQEISETEAGKTDASGESRACVGLRNLSPESEDRVRRWGKATCPP